MKKVYYVETKGAYDTKSLGVMTNYYKNKAIFGDKKMAQEARGELWSPGSQSKVKEGLFLTEDEYNKFRSLLMEVRGDIWNI